MLFKFSSPDILNSALLDASTGAVKYSILTRPHFIHVPTHSGKTELVPSRRSYLLDASGKKKLASWGWTLGMQPTDICIGHEKLDGAKGLFGSYGPPPAPNVFGVSTRFDSECYWMASPTSLKLIHHDANETKGQLHYSSVMVKQRLVHSPLNSGNDYLEMESHPRVSDAELITTFVLMEILRRSRFKNTKSQSASPSSPYSDPSRSRSWLSKASLKRVGQGLTRAMV